MIGVLEATKENLKLHKRKPDLKKRLTCVVIAKKEIVTLPGNDRTSKKKTAEIAEPRIEPETLQRWPSRHQISGKNCVGSAASLRLSKENLFQARASFARLCSARLFGWSGVPLRRLRSMRNRLSDLEEKKLASHSLP